jgi:hypothetical protein
VRALIWAEHLQIDIESVQDALEGVFHMPSAPGEKRGHLVNAAAAMHPVGVDFREVLREMLRLIQHIENWHELATAVLGLAGLQVPPLVAGFDLGMLADLVPDPESFVKDFLNPNASC